MKRPIRADISRADFNEKNVGSFVLQIFGMSVGVAIFTGSIVAGGVALIALAALIASPYAGAVVFTLAALWGAVAAAVGTVVGGFGLGALAGLLAFAWAYTVNQSGAQYMRDVTDDEQTEL